MLIPTDWLQDYLDKKLSPQKMAKAMELAGIEVEAIIKPTKLDKKIIVAQVVRVAKHPNADKLQLATIKTGKGTTELVCGAPNLASGQKVAWASTGSKLADGTLIKAAQIRGVNSYGMLCSAKELGLGNDHSGILELVADAKVGEPAGRYLDSSQSVINVSTAANRPDLRSIVGIAREVAAHTNTKLQHSDQLGAFAKRVSAELLFSVKNKDKVDYYGLASIKLPSKMPPTPKKMAGQLQAAGVRPINLVVDITNYVLLELGQPLHAFDKSKVSGKVIVRSGKKAEKLVSLDGVSRELDAKDIVIADEKGPIGLGGVMGGTSTEITDKTTTILLEAAKFDAMTIRLSAKRWGIRSEASDRFEHDPPVQLAMTGMERALGLLESLAGAKVEAVGQQLNVWPWVQHIGVRPAQLSKLGGLKISANDAVSCLRRLGFVADEFDIVAEAKKHLGKPYKWGASFKTDGTNAFDCGYLIDYIFSLIGVWVGHTAPQQFESGKRVDLKDLRPGDILFRDGPWVKLDRKERRGISHDVIYIGNGQILHARDYDPSGSGGWEKVSPKERKVVIQTVETITQDPHFLGARRHVENLGDYIAVTVPYWRPDVKAEEDVFEEVIKLVGLDKVPATLPSWQPMQPKFEPQTPRLWDLRSLLCGMGWFEVTTYPFVSENQINKLGLKLSDHLKLKNPRSREQAYLRNSLLPGLLAAIANNRLYSDSIGLFEFANVFSHSQGELPNEDLHLGLIVQDPNHAYQNLKTVLDAFAQRSHLNFRFETGSKYAWLHPSRQINIKIGSSLVGYAGELHPALISGHKLKGCAYAHVNADAILGLWESARPGDISKFQDVKRDLTVILKQTTSWAEVAKVLSSVQGLKYKYGGDFYEQNQPGSRALSINMSFGSQNKTLTAAQADSQLKMVLTKLAKSLGAVQKD